MNVDKGASPHIRSSAMAAAPYSGEYVPSSAITISVE
jgi:hypothetical protein